MMWCRMPGGAEARRRAALEDAARHVEAAQCALEVLRNGRDAAGADLAGLAARELARARCALERAIGLISGSTP